MRHSFVLLFVAAALSVQAATSVPYLGNGRLRVLGNNLENYYFNYNTGRGDYSPAEVAAKTRKIGAMILQSDADIFAFCEVEAKPIVLQQLADSLNAYAGVEGRYAALLDGIDTEWDSYYNNNLKSGFIYRTDKVTPYGSNYPATNVTYYCDVMRIQAWEELATGERFTLSMNHFKAKADGASQRVNNANWLVSALNSSYKVQDPDILVMGDLNCQMDEDAITVLLNDGLTEQLLSFDPNAYSYCYQGSANLIDHVFANSSMAGQITGAAVWHYNTTCGGYVDYNEIYSDHDPYLVALNLGGELPECSSIRFSESFAEGLGRFEVVDNQGSSNWHHNSGYSCAYMNAYNTVPDDDWLVSPSFDFTNQVSGEIRFSHALGYGNASDWPSQCQLAMSANYTGDVNSATWIPLEISAWSSSNWQWCDNVVAIPEIFMEQTNVHFAFHYHAESSAPAWEIKNVAVNTVCENSEHTAIEKVENRAPNAQKIIRQGQIIIIRGGVEYTITGQRL